MDRDTLAILVAIGAHLVVVVARFSTVEAVVKRTVQDVKELTEQQGDIVETVARHGAQIENLEKALN